jgi:hypothetical protein
MKSIIIKGMAKKVFILCAFMLIMFQDILAQFQNGDVFVAVGSGQVQRRSSAGVLLQTLNTGQGGFTTGMAFDQSGNLYVTNFSASSVSKFNSNGVLQGFFGSGYSNPESIVFDGSGNAYVGNLGAGIRKFSSAGVFLGTTFTGRVDWMDLAADQCTMLRTTESSFIGTHNVCTNTVLPNFSSGLGGNAYALRIRPNGEVLLANGFNILRLSAAGAVIQTYDIGGHDGWFALNLNNDGTSFWSADFNTSTVHRFDIATGSVLTNFSTGTGSGTVFGLAVFGEFQASLCANNTSPAFVSPTPTCSSTIQAFAGTPVSFTVAASDADVADAVSLNASNVPAGATMTPSLPTNGNPVSSVFSWTPTAADAGTHVITFKAADKCVEVTCSITIDVQACVTQAVCKNATVTLVNGSATVSAADVDGGSTATCGVQSLTVSPATFNCSNIGANNVVLTLTDVNGTVSTCNATVTVVGTTPSCSVTAVPADNTYTGGVPTNIYLGYGPQSVTLNVAPTGGAPFTYSWSPAAGLSNDASGSPVFTPTAPGSYTFTVTVTNTYGCTTTCSITICVQDVRVPGTGGKKVYVCHNTGSGTNTLSISINAVATHLLNHGDHLGDCSIASPCSQSIAAGIRPSLSIPEEIKVDALKVLALPNPASSYFNLLIQSNDQAPVTITITDAFGRLVFKQDKVNPNSSTQIGERLTRGNYFVQVKQGENISSVKLVKM